MILVTHMLAGAALGSRIHSLAMLFILAIALHFLFDRLPHWEYDPRTEKTKMAPKKFFFFLLKVLLDCSLGVLLLWLLWPKFGSPRYVSFGVFFSLLPDGIVFLHYCSNVFFKKEVSILKWSYTLHHRNHIPENKNSPRWGIIIEGLIIIASLLLIL